MCDFLPKAAIGKDEPVAVTFTKDGGDVSSYGVVETDGTVGTAYLVLSNIELRHAGKYACSISVGGLPYMDMATLEVCKSPCYDA